MHSAIVSMKLTIVISTSFSIPVPNDTLKSFMKPKLRHAL